MAESTSVRSVKYIYDSLKNQARRYSPVYGKSIVAQAMEHKKVLEDALIYGTSPTEPKGFLDFTTKENEMSNRKTLYEFAVLYHNPETKETEIDIYPEQYLASSVKQVERYAMTQVHDSHDVEFVEILVRPFCW